MDEHKHMTVYRATWLQLIATTQNNAVQVALAYAEKQWLKLSPLEVMTGENDSVDHELPLGDLAAGSTTIMEMIEMAKPWSGTPNHALVLEALFSLTQPPVPKEPAPELPPLLSTQIGVIQAELRRLLELAGIDDETASIVDAVRRIGPGKEIWRVGQQEQPRPCVPCKGKGRVEVEGSTFQCNSCQGRGAGSQRVSVPTKTTILSLSVERVSGTTGRLEFWPVIQGIGWGGSGEGKLRSYDTYFRTEEECQAYIEAGCPRTWPVPPTETK